MRRWVAVVLVLAVVASAAPRSRNRLWMRFWDRGTFIVQSVVAAVAPSFWSFAPDVTGDGGTITAPVEPCAARAAGQWFDGGGNWFCLMGDGGAFPGSQALSVVGSPTAMAQVQPPLAPGATATTFQRTVTGDGWKTSAVDTAYTGSFSVGGWVRLSHTAGVQYLFTHWTTGSAVTLNYTLEAEADESMTFYVSKAGGTFSSVASAANTLPPGAWHDVLATYKYVADGTSEMRIYVDGVKVATKTNAVGPPQSLSIVHAFGSLGLFAGATTAGDMRAWFATEKWLSDADAAAMSAATWGGAAAFDDGQAVVAVNPSVRTCQVGTTLPLVPAGVPCVTQVGGEWGVLQNETASWNFEHNHKLDTAAWTKSTGVTSACGDPPLDGSNNTAQNPCCNIVSSDGGFIEDATAMPTIDAGSLTVSMYVYTKGATVEPTLVLLDATTDAGVCSVTLPATNLDAGLTRLQCSANVTSGNGFKLRFYPNSATVYACSPQVEPLKAATSYIHDPTWARGATYDTTAALNTSAAIPDAGCATLCMVPTWTGGAVDTQFLAMGASGTALPFAQFATVDGIYLQDPGGNTATPGTGFAVADAPRCAVTTWSAGSYTITDFAATGTNVNGAGLGAFSGGLGLGNDKAATFRNARARLYDVRFANQATACAAGAKLAALGDSKTAGPGGTSTAPTPFLQGLLGLHAGATWAYNFGVPSGGDTAAITTAWQTNVQGKGFRYVTLENGYHDINDHAATGAAVLALWTTLADSIRADGSTLIPLTVSCFHDSGAWTAGKQTALDTLNAGIRTYATAHSLQLVDIYNAPCLCNGNAMWASRTSDGLHQTAEGSAKCIAPLIFAAAKAAGAP